MTGRPIIRSMIRACTRPVIRPTDRVNGAVVQVGQAVYASNGQIWECVVAGTLAGAEPTVIAPIGAPERVTSGNNNFNAADWTEPAGVWITTYNVDGSVTLDRNSDAAVRTLDQNGMTSEVGRSYLARLVVDSANFATSLTYGGVTTLQNGAGDFSEVLTALAASAVIQLTSRNSLVSVSTISIASLIEVTKDGTAAWKTIG